MTTSEPKFRNYIIITDKGPIFTRREFEVVNGIEFPKKMVEIFTQKPCEEYFNYLMFDNGKKYVRFGDLQEIDGDLVTVNKKITELTLLQLRIAIDGYLKEGINVAEQTKKIIECGLSRNEVDELLRKEHDRIVQNEKKFEEEEDSQISDNQLHTFFSVFGDLFRESNNRPR